MNRRLLSRSKNLTFRTNAAIGFLPADMHFIFHRFYRVQDKAVKDIEGDGFGLAVVRFVTEEHGGQVSVERTVGNGTCFGLGLPLF